MKPDFPLLFSEDFGRRFIVFADAEEEFDWNAPFSRTLHGTKTVAALPDATKRFNDKGVQPIYLCDYPVITDPQAARIFQRLRETDQCHIGAQLHPWVTPPHDEALSDSNSFLCNLPVDLQRAKIARLTDAIIDLVGEHPGVFRAGRYGISAATLRLLAELGYDMDVSVRSRFDYRAGAGPDFRDFPVQPWQKAGVTEVPLSASWTGLLRHFPSLHDTRWLRGTLARLSLLSRIPLTPEGISAKEACRAIDVLDREGIQLFSLSFHTPSLVPGHTPYVRTAKDLQHFWTWWDEVLRAFAERNITPIRYDDLVKVVKAAPGHSPFMR